MDKLQAIHAFMTIAERGSLTAAADALDTSLPSVVRLLAALEKNLGVRLFNRTTRRLAITDEGRTYLAHCQRITAAIADSEQSMRQRHAEVAGLITLTAPVQLGEMIVAPLLAGFLAAHPKVEAKLLLLDRVVDLLDEGIDIAVRIAPLHDSTLVARPIAPIRQVIAASPALLARLGTPNKPQDLPQYPCIRSPGVGAAGNWTFVDQGKPRHIKVHGQLLCNSVGASLAACIAGVGFGRYLHYQVMPALRSGALVIVLQDYEPQARPLSLVYPPNRLGSARHARFVDWMVRKLGEALQDTHAS